MVTEGRWGGKGVVILNIDVSYVLGIVRGVFKGD